MSGIDNGFTKNVLYYGREAPLPERIELHAGPLRLVYEQGDLRYVQWGEHEILRRIYVAVRDHNWGTVPAQLADLVVKDDGDSFRITYNVVNRQGGVDFAWQAEITGQPDGTLRFHIDGQSHATFLRNRIGFCILHPATCAGKRCRVEHVDDSVDETVFPLDLCADQPLQPFADMGAIEHEVRPSAWARVAFDGDRFEMEDQRNWTDASYKTYCTPLALPFPVEIKQGERVAQTVTLSLRDERPAPGTHKVAVTAQATDITLDVPPVTDVQPLPLLGLGVASHGQPLSDLELARLSALNLHHLRVDLWLSDLDYISRLKMADGQARALGIGLEVALFISSNAEQELASLRSTLDDLKPPVNAWFVYPSRELYAGGSPTDEVVRASRVHLADYAPGAPFAAGTNTDYIFLKRNPPAPQQLDAVCFAINPQAHAFDNASMVETLEAQAMAVSSARRLVGGLPVVVSPVTLRPRFNPYATGPAPQTPAGTLPSQVDARQMSLFCAGWTACSIAGLAGAGIRSITYYETTGWRGVMETAQGSPLPDLFHSPPGAVFPVYLALADIGQFKGGTVGSLCSSRPLGVSGLVLRGDGRMQIIVANFTAHRQHIVLRQLGWPYGIRMLDETNVLDAMRDPEGYLDRPFVPNPAVDTIEFELLPFALGNLKHV